MSISTQDIDKMNSKDGLYPKRLDNSEAIDDSTKMWHRQFELLEIVKEILNRYPEDRQFNDGSAVLGYCLKENLKRERDKWNLTWILFNIFI